MAIVTGDRYLDNLVKFVEKEAGPLLEGALILKLNPVGLHYVQSRLEQLQELEGLLAGAPVDYLRAYISDLGDHRALEQLRRILRLLTSLKVVSIFPPPARDPTPLSLLPFGRLRVLELRGCDLSTSAARGLLELRHTLEKIICYNSTDALRHIFASRIVNIKDSPVWNKLTFVSCACNELVPMDESLQLLPAVEIMDLSRNRFAKVDNLRKCTKLKHLDLGFNHLRTIASLSEVLCPIVKLVLRNNALTTLRGIENLKSVEGLDLSYNIISNFSELELLAGLSSLENLWLEGNPICCARWYRAHVFSIFTLPDKLKLDERGISRREFWKRQIILASRQKRPAGQGFYSPAKAEDDGGSSFSAKRKKLSRLACIYDDEQRRYFGSDSVEESVSCDSEKLKRDENAISDTEEDLLGLMNRVEFTKKERSVLWLREFREWMDQTSEMDKKFTGPTLSPSEGKYTKRRKSRKHLGESSKHVLDSIHDSGDETSTNAIESESSKHVLDSIQDSGDETSTNAIESEIQFTDVYSGFHAHDSSISSKSDGVRPSIGNGNHEARRQKEQLGSSQEDSFFLNTSNTVGGKRTNPTISTPSLTAIDELMGSRASSMHLGSPPHYEEDILHRRHDLEEEFMQLSAESYSMASSDTDTSCCDDDSSKMSGSRLRFDNLSDEESIDENLGYHHDALFPDNFYDSGCEEPSIRRNTRYLFNSSSEPYSDPDYEMPVDTDDVKMNKSMSQEVGFLEERTKRVLKKRVISLSEETFTTGKKKSPPSKLNGKLEIGNVCNEDGKIGEDLCEFDILQSQSVGYKLTMGTEVDRLLMCGAGNCTLRTHEFIKDYFNNKIADSRVSETCLQCVRCRCILQGSDSRQKEVAVLLSSVNKVYILVIDAKDRGPGDLSKVLGCYRLKDTKDVLIGIGLQVLSVQFVRDAPFLFVTRTIEISRALLSLLRVCDASETNHKCSLRSWEQVQAELFEKSICSGLKVSIFLYSMVLFWHKSGEGDSWFSRSLFVIEEYVLVCVEDLVKFGSVTDNDQITSPYFILDSCCSIRNISEMVIDTRESRCLTLTMDRDVPQNIHFLAKLEKGKQLEEGSVAPLTWRLKWFSEDTLLKFVALLKAIHAGISMSPLPVRCAS